jgi:DNA polymerase III subunit epsilon
MNFMAIDVETANADMASICSIGLVYFKEGVVSKRLGFLVDPEDDFDAINVSIHGIRPEDVVGAPNMKKIFPLVAAALVTTIIVHHTHFDRVAFCRAAAKYSFQEPCCAWLDSARVARRAWDRFSQRGYGLGNLSAEFGIQFKHHEAAEDAYAAGMIILRAMSDTGMSLEDWVTRAAQPLRGEGSKGRYARAGNPLGPLAGETVVFTGALSMTRADAAAHAADPGCHVADRVTNDTTILVVGDQDIRRLAGKDKSDKHLKAEKLIQAGAMLRIVSESDFFRMVRTPISLSV